MNIIMEEKEIKDSAGKTVATQRIGITSERVLSILANTDFPPNEPAPVTLSDKLSKLKKLGFTDDQIGKINASGILV